MIKWNEYDVENHLTYPPCISTLFCDGGKYLVTDGENIDFLQFYKLDEKYTVSHDFGLDFYDKVKKTTHWADVNLPEKGCI